MRSRLSVILFFAFFGLCLCSCSSGPTFDEEYQTSIRAGKGELTESELGDLKKINPVIIMQMSDPTTLALLKGFAELTSSSHDVLRADGYLKWNYTDLDASTSTPFKTLVEANLAMARGQGVEPAPGFSLDALRRAQVGYAIVEAGKRKDQKVVSLFILWPELPDPSWKTVVNGKLAGTQEYFREHLIKLQSLKSAKTSPLP